MFKKLILSTLIGAIIMFAWGMVSWMVLPWHMNTLKQFTNDDAVASALVANAPETGIYILPHFTPKDSSKTKEEHQAQMKLTMEKIEKGPFAFVSVVPKGMSADMTREMLMAFVAQLIGAFLISLLLLKMASRSYGCRLLTVFLVATLVGFLGNAPYHIWWGFEMQYSVVMMLDAIIGWTLAGLFMAGIMKGNANR